MESNIVELERRFKRISADYQAGKIDETAYLAEVDKLQFQDDRGRYWMLGAKSGAWHYYDGQTWHQADPNDADKLPFMDDQGRYWQRGAKSGSWYYYQPETNEWVKPGEEDPSRPVPVASRRSQASSAAYPLPQPHADTGSGQFGAELFQDDDGRYWAVGAKTGLWYFYDESGWHPAHEYQGTQPQPRQAQTQQPLPHTPYQYSQPAVQQPTQTYQAQAAYSTRSTTGKVPAPQQRYSYSPAPGQAQAFYGQPAADQSQPVAFQQPGPLPASQPGPAGTGSQAHQPVGVSAIPGAAEQSGSWFYFDGKQWMQYATGTPVADTPPDPSLIVEQEAEGKKPASSSKEDSKSEGDTKAKEEPQPVVAEFFEDDEPPVEVVDVEVITVLDAEPDTEDDDNNINEAAYLPPPQPKPAPAPTAQPTLVASAQSLTAASTDEVRPRRSRPVPVQAKTEPDPTATSREEKPAMPRRTTQDPSRQVSPRQRTSSPNEPTIIIPTGSKASPSPTGSGQSGRQQTLGPMQQRLQARENTLPMEPLPAATQGPSGDPLDDASPHRQVTQSMPVIARSASTRTASEQARVVKRASQITQPQPVVARSTTPAPTPIPAAVPAAGQPTGTSETSEKERYTLGDAFRAVPSTLWTIIAGVALLIIVAVFIIGAVVYGNSFFGGSTVAAVSSPTPTLEAGPPDSTPTPGPTPTVTVAVNAVPTQVPLTALSSQNVGITLEYPENWQVNDTSNQVLLSPSEAGLEPDTFNDTTMRIGTPDDDTTAISDLLSTILAEFPLDSEILNEGTINIASQTWTSTQIRFDDEDLGGKGIATLAVTNKDGTGFYLMAVAPAEQWNTVQPIFQAIINSFRFGAEELVAQAEATRSTRPTRAATTANSEEEDADDEEPDVTPTPTEVPPTPTPEPEVEATPLVYAVESGDTLLGIAVRFGVDLDLLASENGITNPEALQIGQELTIPFTAEELAAYNSGTPLVADEPDEPATTAGTDNTESDAAGPEAPAAAAAAAPAAPAVQAESAPVSVSGRIVYPAFNPSINSYDVWMADLSSGEQTPIVGNASQPAFNKDGSLLAYRSWEPSTRGIFFRDFVGGNGGKVTKFVEDALPVWMPDGFNFTFASRKEGDRVTRVYVGTQAGEDPFSTGFQGEYPGVFPDGRIVSKGCLPSGDCGIFVMGARGGNERKISGEPGDTAPAPAPDGSKIAFMSNGRGGQNWEVWVMSPDGSNPVRLTENSNNDGLPTWSPDGRSIAFVSDRGGVWAVWAMNADGSSQRKLFDMKGSPQGNVLHDESNSRGWLEERISWAP